jgi:hypothetical protein
LWGAQGSAKTKNLSKRVLPFEPWAHAALAARDAGIAAPQRKTASEQLMDQRELLPMRLARVRAGDPTSGRLECCVKSCLERSASIRPSPETPDGYRNRDPRKDHYISIPQRNPSAATNQGKSRERRQKPEQPAAASTLSLQPTLLPSCQLQQRAGLKCNFANSIRPSAI